MADTRTVNRSAYVKTSIYAKATTRQDGVASEWSEPDWRLMTNDEELEGREQRD